MLDFTNCNIEYVCTHGIGNRTNGEDLYLSKELIDISDLRLRELLVKYFLFSFYSEEYYSFTFSNEDFNLNPVYSYVSNIFEKKLEFYQKSTFIAKHLYEISVHPQIKSGDLFIVLFSDINIDGILTDCIGIFKSENKHPFLKLNNINETFSLSYDQGINIEKLDKGCLVFNINKEKGFKVCIVDKSNKSSEALFWKESFLNLKPCDDAYHNTKEFLSLTKEFVTQKLSEEYGINKSDQIDLLNRSIEYFKTHDSFNKKEFNKEVLITTDYINSFIEFENTNIKGYKIGDKENFDVSKQMVKKQSRIFKKTIKLDQNFDIYIHGDKRLIEQGIEQDGRKFYKIYYENEI